MKRKKARVSKTNNRKEQNHNDFQEKRDACFFLNLELFSVKNFGSISSFCPLECETAFFSSFSANSLCCIIYLSGVIITCVALNAYKNDNKIICAI